MAADQVGIIGATIHGNRGATAMLETLAGRLRAVDPGRQIAIFSYYPETDARLISDPKVIVASASPADLVLKHFPGALIAGLFRLFGFRWPDALLPRDIRELRRCEMLLDVAGICFSDGREKFLPFNILTIWPAMMLGIPVVKCSQALGPFENLLTRWSAKLFLPHCKMIFGRGSETLAHLDSLAGLKDRFQSAGDLAFLHRNNFALSSENQDRVRDLMNKLKADAGDGRPLICVCPSNIASSSFGSLEAYARAMASLADGLAAGGNRVIVMPTATRENSPKAHNNDINLVNMISSGISGDHPKEWLYLVNWDIAFSDIKNIIQLTDGVITFRFHGLVAALSTCRPTIAVGWGHKYRELLRQFGLEDYDINHQDVDMTGLVQRANQLLEAGPDISRQIQEALPEVEAACEIQIDYILSTLPEKTHV